jgi:hypothetical protein
MSMNKVEWEWADLLNASDGNVLDFRLVTGSNKIVVNLFRVKMKTTSHDNVGHNETKTLFVLTYKQCKNKSTKTRVCPTLPLQSTRRLTDGFGTELRTSKMVGSTSGINLCKNYHEHLVLIQIK